jgi:hypothetical protein
VPELLIAQRHVAHLDRVAQALRLVHDSDGYPMAWPDDPIAWLTPAGTLDAWVALADGEIVGHVMLVDGAKVEFAAELAEAAGVPVTGLAGVSRLFVTPAAQAWPPPSWSGPRTCRPGADVGSCSTSWTTAAPRSACTNGSAGPA